MGKYHNLMMHIALILLMMGIALGIGGTSPAFADEKAAALEVRYDGELLKSFTMDELQEIARQEGSKKYTYSRFNTNETPSFDVFRDVEGPTIQKILDTALNEPAVQIPGAPTAFEQLGGDQTIELRAASRSANAYRAVFTKTQLFTQRYYYPHVDKEWNRGGKAALPESYQDRKPVPPILSLTEPEDPNKAGRSLYGQLVPNEQNAPDCVQGMIGKAVPGIINISGEAAAQWNALQKATAGGGEVAAEGGNKATAGSDKTGAGAPFISGNEAGVGVDITFDRDINDFSKNGGQRYWIYYTTDGSEPTLQSNQYNYNNNAFGDVDEKINKPKVEQVGELIVKAKVIGNGKLDSDTVTFRFQGVRLVDVTIQGRTEKTTYDGGTHTAKGYQVTKSSVDKSAELDKVSVALLTSGTDQVSAADAGLWSMGLTESSFRLTAEDAEYRIGKVTIHDGLLTIEPAKLTVVTDSAKKTFDGKALTAGGTIEGLVNGETAAFAVTGKQTDAGKSKNTYSLNWNGSAKKNNYSIQESLGELTVEMPKVKAPALKPLTLKKKTITVKWSKVSGASGYQIYRSQKKSSGFKLVKTIKKGSTVTWKNTKLAKKTYYYKVRAYRVIAGKTVYSGYSAVKYKKVK